MFDASVLLYYFTEFSIEGALTTVTSISLPALLE